MIRRLDDFLHPIPADWRVERFPVGDGHELHVEHTGAGNGIPLISLHAGPAAARRARSQPWRTAGPGG